MSAQTRVVRPCEARLYATARPMPLPRGQLQATVSLATWINEREAESESTGTENESGALDLHGPRLGVLLVVEKSARSRQMGSTLYLLG